MHFLAIVLLSVVASVLYGIVHDQITARICVEYFTIGHPVIFATDDPTLLAFGWGILATWWVGLVLGIFLAIASRVGSSPKYSAGELVRPIFILVLSCGVVATAAGSIGYVAATRKWMVLTDSLVNRVPPEKHIPFLVDLCAHSASYLAAFVGGAFLVGWVWQSRRQR